MTGDAPSLLSELIERYPLLSGVRGDIERAYETLLTAYRAGAKVLVCGNGGSAADADHIVGELMKGFHLLRPLPESDRARIDASLAPGERSFADRLQRAIPAICLSSHAALTSAFANDVSPELVFAQQVYGYGRPGDVVWGLSTSGNSANIVTAIQTARALGLATLALTGGDGGRLARLADVCVIVPASRTDFIQELHLPIYHAICAMLEAEVFGA